MNISELSNKNFDKKKAIGLIHKVYLSNLKTSKKYTASTKTKSEVQGGGKKPWRQKGTGQARAGSTRSPLWKGGGVIFGPKPRAIEKKINKKEKKYAIIAAFLLKKNLIKVVKQSIFLEKVEAKTKSFIKFLNTLQLSPSQQILVIVPVLLPHLQQATQNLQKIKVVQVNSLMLSEILKATTILISDEALPMISNIYGNTKKI